MNLVELIVNAIFVCIGFSIGSAIGKKVSEKLFKTEVKSSICRTGHRWIYVDEGTDTEYMECSVCKKTPENLTTGAVK